MTESTETVEQNTSETQPNLSGISGWLILLALGFVFGIPLSIGSIIYKIAAFPAYHANGFGGLCLFELIVQMFLLAFLIYAAVPFFRKKKNAPAVLITFMIVNICAVVIVLIVEQGMGATSYINENGRILIRQIIRAAIWIPYLKVSKRVKATFVN